MRLFPLSSSVACVIHAVMLRGALAFLGVAQHMGYLKDLSVNGLGPHLWFFGLVSWPVWLVIVPLTSHNGYWRAAAFLVVGTLVWLWVALPFLFGIRFW